MAIRWLEAARYSDTNGYQTDGPRTMWPWRDWVINAFHKDMPFDQFTVEQIAGDCFRMRPVPEDRNGFHRNHRTSAEAASSMKSSASSTSPTVPRPTGTVWMG
jgi:hypothetical protein